MLEEAAVGLEGTEEAVLEYSMSIMNFLSLDRPLTAAADAHVEFTQQEFEEHPPQ